MTNRSIATETVAEAYFALLRSRGIERIFVNGGTDFAPVAEAYARLSKTDIDLPTPVIVPHESVAVGMAHGAYLVTGKPQAVMLHVSVGTANAVMAIINASRDRVPILLSAGRTPLFEGGVLGARNGGIHWAQEMFDQAGMLRELVKWDYELRDGVQIEAIVDREMSVAMTEPRGPVYLSLPREVLARGLDGFTYSEKPQVAATDPAPSHAAIDVLADAIAGARFPVIVTSGAAIRPGTFNALAELASAYGIGIVEDGARFVNVSREHPLHLGFSSNSVFGDADVLCFADCDVPWMPAVSEPPADTMIVQCGVDPLYARYPIRTHRSDLAITGSSAFVFEALIEALEIRKGKIDPARYERIAELALTRREQRRAAAKLKRESSSGISKSFMNWTLAQARPEGAIIVDEYWARADLMGSTVEGSEFHNPPSAGLGWAVPASLGVQLESPGRIVFSTVGDGAYMFANPPACHQVMATNHLPVITVVCNNGRWGAVQGSAIGMYPDGYTAAGGTSPLAVLDQSHSFELYAEATGGYGERVADRSELKPALERALDVARNEGRHSVLNVISED